MGENVAGDDDEPKPGKIKASDEAFGVGSGDVKPTVLMKPVKVKILFQAHIGKIERKKNLNWYLPVLIAKFATPPHFLQQMKYGESEKSYLVGFVDKRQGPDLLFVSLCDYVILRITTNLCYLDRSYVIM